jgi:hypothetical protein
MRAIGARNGWYVSVFDVTLMASSPSQLYRCGGLATFPQISEMG